MSARLPAALIALVFGCLLSACSLDLTTAPRSSLAGPVVKVMIGNEGHGSGTHLGNGYILTAAHVVEGQKTLGIVLDNGKTATADVLWASPDYDVALIRAPIGDLAGSSHLACRSPAVGETIHSSGNPGPLDFITTWGRVAGAARAFAPWKSVFIVDAAIIPGVSGGPVYDGNGDVIGVNVGVMLSQVGFEASLTNLGFIVPGSTVCALMGKGVTA
jgi:S1-C subfamily serine protease